jgi:hypothetical protein
MFHIIRSLKLKDKLQKMQQQYAAALLFIFSFSFLNCLSQKENNQWLMAGYPATGGNSLIDFNIASPAITNAYANYLFFLTNASICDTSGQLLFYTNGKYVANRNHDTLDNSQSYNPGWITNYYAGGLGVHQACIFLPKPNDYGRYYLFHESGELVQMNNGQIIGLPIRLSYSLIDLSLDSGQGGIVQGKKNITIVNDTLMQGRVTATKHGNGRDWWVVAHGADNNVYHKVLVTPDTLITSTQAIGSTHDWERFTQQATFSPDGMKYVIEIDADTLQPYPNTIDLYDFDRCTGLFSTQMQIIVPDTFYLAWGCSFSPDSRFLYISTLNKLFQYDTWSSNINASVKLVSTPDSNYTQFLFHQIAPDGNIYISTLQSSQTLHYINDPNQIDTNCNVIQNSFPLPVLNNFAMPNAPNYSLGALTGSPCDTLTNINALDSKRNLDFKINPNPVLQKRELSLSYVLPQNKQGLLEIFNVNGVKVYSAILSQWSSLHKVKANFLAGIYSAVLTSDSKRSVVKFVVVKE